MISWPRIGSFILKQYTYELVLLSHHIVSCRGGQGTCKEERRQKYVSGLFILLQKLLQKAVGKRMISVPSLLTCGKLSGKSLISVYH